MGMPTRVKMPDKDGKPIINPIRYACDHGHVHPSYRHAVACNVRHRKKK